MNWSIGRMLDMPFFVRVARPFRAAKPTYGMGDVLKLKSGGCAMTVACSGPVLFASGNWLIRQWLNDAGELTQETFPEETLEPQRSKARLSHTGQ